MHLTDEEFLEMSIKAIMNNLIDVENAGEQLIYDFYLYTEIECKNLKKCYLKVDEYRHILCSDDGFEESGLVLDEYNGEYYLPISEKVDCGYACCKTTYRATVFSDQNNHKYWQILESYSTLISSCPDYIEPNCLDPNNPNAGIRCRLMHNCR
jgi:hypothetical protein